MGKNAKVVAMSVVVFTTAVTIALAGYMFSYSSIYIPIGMISAALLCFGIFSLGVVKRKKFLYKLGMICSVVASIGLAIYIALDRTGALTLLSNEEGLRDFIAKSGVWGPLVYILIQFLQVTFVPIPSTITVIAGSYIFSMVEVILFSTIGMIMGSMFAFFLGKTFGVKLVVWLVGEKSFNKYQKIIRGRDKTMLFLMFLLPVFPDDLLCLIAGITTMNYGTFFIMQIVSRPIGITMSSLFKVLLDMPFTGWYIAIWIGMIVGVALMFFLVWKFSGKIEDALVKFIINKFGGKSGRTIDEVALGVEVKNLVSNATVISDNDNREQELVPEVVRPPRYFVNYY